VLKASLNLLASLSILARPDGTPWKLNQFQKAAGKAIRAAGLEVIVWHGLRGAAASWSAEGGASEKALQALLGHTTSQMAQKYSRGADQRRLAGQAVAAITLPAGNTPGPSSAKRRGRKVPNATGATS